MKTILVLAPHPELPEAIRSALNPEEYRMVHRLDAAEAEPFLNPSLVDACVFDAENAGVQVMWSIERVRRSLPSIPILIYAGAGPWEWEEEAYQQGVSHVLAKPVRPRLLHALLARLWNVPSATRPAATPSLRRPAEAAVRREPGPRELQALEVFRDFSSILTHSLSTEGLVKQFLLQIREILGINRALVFLRRPSTTFEAKSAEASGRLTGVCAIGLGSGLLAQFELTTVSGIGSYLYHQGRVLRRESQAAQEDPVIQKEFELMGTEVALPILDRETFIGVAAFDGRLTGEPLANAELELIFHLLEELALAVKNIWLHDQLASNHETLMDILRQLSSACLVIGRDLKIQHANKAARGLFVRAGRRHTEFDFTDLPQFLATKIYQVLKTGTALAPFRYQRAEESAGSYSITILPLQRQDATSPHAALLLAEDHTQAEQIQRLEVEAANLRLVRTMADRLAHEIGNALVPISTHQQLLTQSYHDPEFRISLAEALMEGVKRISRLSSQMRFLARDTFPVQEAVPLEPLIEEAFEEAKRYQPVPSPHLSYENGSQPAVVAGDRAALKHAFTELLINALQANPTDGRVGVRTEADLEGNGTRRIRIEVLDNGPGFSADLIAHASEPFFTTRNVGLGLGLAVSKKIIETHQGKLALSNSPEKHSGLVRISLPAAVPSAPN
jgi:signal transduction histidine kinase/DNA-binding NarL/FixJ family response regulator